jgi:formate dehydrogenase subunit delta
MSPDKLAHMANQIGTFFQSQKNEDAVASIADHLKKFWDPRMRRDFLAHLDDVTLIPVVREAAERLKTPA